MSDDEHHGGTQTKMDCWQAERLVGLAANVSYSGQLPEDFDTHLYLPIKPKIEWEGLENAFGKPLGLQPVLERERARFEEAFEKAQDAFFEAVSDAREVFHANTFAEALRLTEPSY